MNDDPRGSSAGRPWPAVQTLPEKVRCDHMTVTSYWRFKVAPAPSAERHILCSRHSPPFKREASGWLLELNKGWMGLMGIPLCPATRVA
jgi:hypothetical protein